MSKKISTKVIISIVVIVTIGVIALLSWSATTSPFEQDVVCTLEARLCPDGSYVGRTGPNCEFAPCQGGIVSEWIMTTDEETGAIFSYPDPFPADFIIATNWPPELQIREEPFECIESTSPQAPFVTTFQQEIGDRTFCVTEATEGTAGSVYNEYTYAFASSGDTVSFAFTLQSVNCSNYSPTEQALCEQEQQGFNLNDIARQMADSLRR